MARKQPPSITDSEWLIMNAVWDKAGITAAEIVSIVKAKKNTSMRTVKTLIRRLMAKGALSFRVDEKDSRIYHYYTEVAKEDCVRSESAKFLDLIYQNNIGRLVNDFVLEGPLDKNEIAMLEELVKRLKAGEDGEGGSDYD